MTSSQVAGLASRIVALFMFLSALQVLSSALVLLRVSGIPDAAAAELAMAVVTLAFGFFLWRYPLAVARFLIPTGADSATSMNSRETWSLGFVLVGLLTLASGVPLLLQDIAALMSGNQSEFNTWSPDLVVNASKTALGLGFVFGNQHLYRRFGAAHQPAVQAEDPASAG